MTGKDKNVGSGLQPWGRILLQLPEEILTLYTPPCSDFFFRPSSLFLSRPARGTKLMHSVIARLGPWRFAPRKPREKCNHPFLSVPVLLPSCSSKVRLPPSSGYPSPPPRCFRYNRIRRLKPRPLVSMDGRSSASPILFSLPILPAIHPEHSPPSSF